MISRWSLLPLILLALRPAGTQNQLQEVPQHADPTDLRGVMDLMWSNIGNIVRSAVEPPVARLQGRLTGVQTGIQTQLTSIQTQLTSIQAQLDGKEASRQDRIECQSEMPRDCSDLSTSAESGVHLLQPGLRQPVPAFCDQDTDGGGWTVIQRRADIQPRQDFYLGWQEYKWGFGELDAEFWWGLEHVWLMTHLLDRRYQMRVDLEDFDGDRRAAVYDHFSVSPEEDGYRLTAENYTGSAGDSLRRQSGRRFTTKDRDQDTTNKANCAVKYKGAWWHEKCHDSNLNGRYLSGHHSSTGQGVEWNTFRGNRYSLKFVEMKIRPVKKLRTA